MSNDFRISDELRVVDVQGLVRPTRRPQRHLLDWTVDGVHRPDYFRWSWSPVNGDLLIGAVQRHAYQIPKSDPNRPFESWVRGFVFLKERQVAIRPFWWPLSVYEQFDHDANRRVMKTVTELLRPCIPQSYRIHLSASNEWLLDRYSGYSTSW